MSAVKRFRPHLIVKICAGGWLVKSQHERIQRIVAGPFKTEGEARRHIAAAGGILRQASGLSRREETI